MLKRIGIIKRPEGMTREQLRDHWLNVHGPIAMRIPGLRGYRLNFVESWLGDNSQDWDGFAELWFDDQESMAAGFAALADEIAADRDQFVGTITVGIVEENVLLPGPAGRAGG
jgi:uncharacterized protein (TIGR02118 family)